MQAGELGRTNLRFNHSVVPQAGAGERGLPLSVVPTIRGSSRERGGGTKRIGGDDGARAAPDGLHLSMPSWNKQVRHMRRGLRLSCCTPVQQEQHTAQTPPAPLTAHRSPLRCTPLRPLNKRLLSSEHSRSALDRPPDATAVDTPEGVDPPTTKARDTQARLTARWTWLRTKERIPFPSVSQKRHTPHHWDPWRRCLPRVPEARVQKEAPAQLTAR